MKSLSRALALTLVASATFAGSADSLLNAISTGAKLADGVSSLGGSAGGHTGAGPARISLPGQTKPFDLAPPFAVSLAVPADYMECTFVVPVTLPTTVALLERVDILRKDLASQLKGTDFTLVDESINAGTTGVEGGAAIPSYDSRDGKTLYWAFRMRLPMKDRALGSSAKLMQMMIKSILTEDDFQQVRTSPLAFGVNDPETYRVELLKKIAASAVIQGEAIAALNANRPHAVSLHSSVLALRVEQLGVSEKTVYLWIPYTLAVSPAPAK